MPTLTEPTAVLILDRFVSASDHVYTEAEKGEAAQQVRHLTRQVRETP